MFGRLQSNVNLVYDLEQLKKYSLPTKVGMDQPRRNSRPPPPRFAPHNLVGGKSRQGIQSKSRFAAMLAPQATAELATQRTALLAKQPRSQLIAQILTDPNTSKSMMRNATWSEVDRMLSALAKVWLLLLLDDFSAVFRTCQWQLLNGLRVSSQIVFQILKGVLSKREMFHHSIIIVESIIRRSHILYCWLSHKS